MVSLCVLEGDPGWSLFVFWRVTLDGFSVCSGV